jgi:signal transduction histidine kinase/CheY-like chemotaxis protein
VIGSQEPPRPDREAFVQLVEKSPLGIYVVDATFRLRHVSAGARKVFSNVRPLLGRDFAEILREIWAEPFATEAIGRFRHTLETGEPYGSPNTTERRQDIDDIEAYDWRIERIVMPDGSAGVVCYFYDLSARRKAELALERADRAKTAFLATLAHELRNPLAPLRNSVELIERSPGDEALRHTAMGIMRRQIDHLSRLVDDLLEVSRIEHGKIELRIEPFTLVDALRAAIEIVQPSIEQRRQRLELRLPAATMRVNGDAARVTQVIANLLHNAAKFTPAGGEIRLAAEARGAQAVIRVCDNGRGITAEELPHIFELFDQGDLHERERTRGGLGIGLSLARSLVEMQGGRIAAHSAGRGRGSEFTVRLPLAQSRDSATTAPLPATPSAPISARRILVVDDNRDSADSLAELLRLNGNAVETAYGGRAAVAVAAECKPEVVLLDIGMPDMNGHEVCRALRAEPWARDVAIVALTGWAQDQDREKSHDAGFDGHLVKPVDQAALERLLGTLLTRPPPIELLRNA